jgi:AraC-like DNA-binding protein
MAYQSDQPVAAHQLGTDPIAPITDLQRILDPRLEWVHDKDIGPDRNQALYNVMGVVWKVTAGRVTVRTAKGSWDAGAGDWVVLQPGHRFQGFSEGTRLWSIAYRFNRTRGSSWFAGPDVLVLRDCTHLEVAGRRMIRLMESVTGASPVGWQVLGGISCSLEDWMRIDATFRLVLAALIRTVGEHGLAMLPSTYPDERIRLVMAALASDPWAASCEPSALARTAKLSRRRLEQLFAGAIGHGLAEERTRRRLESACELLLRRDLQIKQVASRCGFPRSSTFSTWFRRHAGVPPLRFRRNGMGGSS